MASCSRHPQVAIAALRRDMSGGARVNSGAGRPGIEWDSDSYDESSRQIGWTLQRIMVRDDGHS